MAALFARAIATYLIARGEVAYCQVRVQIDSITSETSVEVSGFDRPSALRYQRIHALIRNEFVLRYEEIVSRFGLQSWTFADSSESHHSLFGVPGAPWEFRKANAPASKVLPYRQAQVSM